MTIMLAGPEAARLSAPVLWESAVARWLMLAGLSVALGGLAAAWPASTRAGSRLRCRPHPITTGAAARQHAELPDTVSR